MEKENLVNAHWLVVHMSEGHRYFSPHLIDQSKSHGHCNLRGWGRRCIVPPYPWEENLVDSVKDCHTG